MYERVRSQRDNTLSPDEEKLVAELAKLGREDMVEAVKHGIKYHRLDYFTFRETPTFEGAVGLRLAFDPDAHVPASKDKWIEQALEKYKDDEALQHVVKEWAEVQAKQKAEETNDGAAKASDASQ
jgi:hypothetical protein